MEHSSTCWTLIFGVIGEGFFKLLLPTGWILTKMFEIIYNDGSRE